MIEVLVVTGIIAILSAIVYPVLQKTREKAHESVCASNLHQLHAALEMYLQDNDERFPVSYVATQLDPYQSWREAVQPYVRNQDLLVCPSSDDAATAEETPQERASYALNAWLSPPNLTALGGGGSGLPVTLSAVASPAATIALCDAGYSNAPVALDYDHYQWLDMQEQPLPTERHLGGANFGFVDGHVKKMTEAATRLPEYLWDLQ